jgi:hypothetical protein
LSLHTEFLLLFENAALLREILTWGREISRQVQDLKISGMAFQKDHVSSYLSFIKVVLKLLGRT